MQTEVPEGWSPSRIGDFAWEVTERAKGSEEVLSVTKHRGFVPSLEYFGKQVFSKDVENYKVVRRGQFAYATIHLDEGSIDCLRVCDQGIISPMYTVFDTDSGKVDQRYLLELLKTPFMLARYSGIGQGSINRRKSIGFESLSSEAVPLPPLPEQKKIAEILGSVDEAIRATEAVIEQTRRVKEGLLQELLTKGIGHTRFKQTEIGEIPEGWGLTTIKDVAVDRPNAVLAGPFGTIFKAKDFRPRGVPIIQLRHIREDGFSWSSKDTFMDEAVYERLHRPYSVVSGDVLVTKLGDPPGLACRYPEGQPTAMVTPDVIKATIDPTKMLPAFAIAAYNSPGTRRRVMEHQKGGTRPRVTLDMFYSLPLPWPDLKEQEAIVERVDAVDQWKLLENLKLAQLRLVKEALLQDLLTGKVRVKL